MRTRAQAAAALIVTLDALPDDTFQQIIDAVSSTSDGVPLFEAVKGLACSKALRQQLHRLQPLVGVESVAVVARGGAFNGGTSGGLAVVARATARFSCHRSPSKAVARAARGHGTGPWRAVLLYKGRLTQDVVEQARQGRVRTIDARFMMLACRRSHVVPVLLGAGSSLLELDISQSNLNNTWAATFGEAAVCSAVLRSLRLEHCGLRGPLPELRLPALQELLLWGNDFTGGLEPLHNCTALRHLQLHGGAAGNHLSGGLEPLRNCTALQTLNLASHKLTGDLEPLRGCTALVEVHLHYNQLTGSLEPLRGCATLQRLYLLGNPLTPTEEDKAHFQKQCPTFDFMWLTH